MAAYPQQVRVVEVGPRDGLQNVEALSNPQALKLFKDLPGLDED